MLSLKNRIGPALTAVVFLVAAIPTASSTHGATGRFEVYCDSFGFFLEKIDGAPPPGRFFLFLFRGFLPLYEYLPERQELDVSVYPKGCNASLKCESVATAKLWLDAQHQPGGTQISGEYDIDWHGQHLKGQFLARRHQYKKPPRICM